MKTTRLLCVVTIACLAVLAFGTPPARAQSADSNPLSLPEVKDLPEHKEMPDPLTMFNGQKVTTPEQWQQRREEMKQILEFYELGHAPPPPGNVTGVDLESRDLQNGAVKFRLVHLKFGPEQKCGFDIAILTPAGNGPFPTIINPSFFSTPGARSTNMPAAATNSGGTDSTARPRVPFFGGPVTPETAASNFDMCLRRGYAVVTYRYTQCGEDNANFRSSSFYPAYPGYDWGVLLGWAWGLSRCVDYVETQPFADKTKIIALGHSRLGKLTMVATAFDDRIAMGAPAGSSGAGTGAYRFCGPGRGGKEGIEDMTRKFPYYFVPRLREFTGQINKLPFEASWYIALAAPRPWISVEGTEDQNCVANAVKQSVLAAQPVYAFLGVPVDRVGVNYENHRHALTPGDWKAALDFADKYLRGMKVDRTFDHFPPEVSASGSGTTAPLDVHAFGATGDGKTKDTDAFQKALDACAVAGGGDVSVPAGDYLIGSIELKSNTILRLAKGARLMGSPDLDDYPIIKVRWEGRWVDGHRAIVFATNAAHIGIIGPGEILGNPALGGREMPRRPVIIEPIDCRDVRFGDFSTQHHSMWSIHPTYCEDVVATNLSIHSTGGNGDGIDVDSCKHVRIESCDIETGDDCVAIKSGRGMEGYRAARPTEDVLIARCTMADSIFACIGIGSETSGGIRGVRIEHCGFARARTYAIYIKSRPGRGAFIEDISGNDLDVLTAPGGFLRINLLNSGIQDPEPVPGDEGIPSAKNFTFGDVKVHCGTLVDAASIPSAKPLNGLTLTNITGDCTKGITLANITGAHLSGINVTGYTGQFLTQTNVEGSGLVEAQK